MIERSIADLFVEQARRRPAAPALDMGDRELTYGELDRLSARLARRLVALGVGPGVRVAFSLRRPDEVVVAMVAVARAGGAYVPVDPSYPAESAGFLLRDSGAAVVLGEDLAFISGGSGGESGAEGPLPDVIPPESLALVIYTSGSTGRPKGVAIPQHGVIRLVREADYVQLDDDDRVAMVSNTSFDAATWEVWGALLNGGCLVPIGRESLLAPARLAAALRERRVSALFLTTALFNQVAREVPEAFAPLRCLLFGGERADPISVRRVLAAGPPARLLHVYGPTENSTFTTWEEVREVAADAATVPIGRAIANTHVQVVDEELWIGGAGLAWGYWERPDVTAERFVPAPWGAPGERLYRSGDRVRPLPGGRLEFLGRIDRQVKIRGFRIEPGEVEAALALHPAVRDAAVVAREDVPGERRLVAYGVAGESVDGAALRAFLAERLPPHLVPAVVVLLPRLPLNANGKVDRDALPPPELVEGAADSSPLPQAPSPLVELIAGIWAALLGRQRVDPHEDFFALGGHSLLATRAIARVRESCGVDLPLEALFEEPTAAGLARRIEQAALAGDAADAADAGPILPAGRSGPLPLTFAQERLWLLDKASPGGWAYNLPLLLRLDGPLVPAALAAALAEVERRHESLRTTFSEVDGLPVQRVEPPAARPLPVVDLRALPAARREEELARRVDAEGERPFDLQRGPLLRRHLFRLAGEASALLAVAHHIVADGWSLGLLQHEIAAGYEAALEGRPAPLEPLPLQVPDLAVWERGRPLAAGLAYWRERLAGLPRLELPADRRPTVRGTAGATREIPLPPALGAAAGRLARQEGATLFLTLLAAFAALLHRLTGSDDLALGTPVAQRDRGEVEGLIGFLVNTLVVRLDLGGDPGFAALLARARSAVLAAHARREVPFERLVAELRPARHRDENPLVQAAFSLNPPVPPAVAAGVRFRLERPRTATAKFDLALEVLGEAPDLRGFWEFPTARFEPATVARFAAGFEALLAGAVADPARSLSQLDLLGAGARHQLLAEWNDAATAYPRESTLPGLFAEQAARTPGAPAVEGPGGVLTYRDLARRAAGVARRLRALDLAPDDRVGVRLQRGADQVAAFLGILLAGGAYVPLDPGYPEERLAFMAADAGLRALLTSVEEVEEEVEETEADRQAPDDPSAELTADHLAYVIYTSGSTGRPKGVAVTHRAVVRLVRDTDYVQLTPSDRVAQASNASFDAATFEIWGALLNGACLVILDRETTLAPDLFARALTRQRITALFLTTALFNLLANADPACFRTLSHLLFGGEAVDPARVAAVLAAAPPARLLHVYGPTESTTFATWQRLDAVPPGAWNLPIGRPLANTRALLLDAGFQPVPIGAHGEVFLGGDGLARGYTRPELTAERFVPDPFGAGDRLYRTGDLARQRGDGAIEFLGRRDSQVKIRGFRIEPAEVEAALGTHPEVTECVVLARRGPRNETALAAFAGGHAEAPALRAHLSRLLPDFMVPASFVILPELPKNANGKIDRAELLELPEEPAAPAAGAPRTPTEEILCGLWAELLERPSVGIHDDFFALGGHSLLGTRLMARVRQLFAPALSLRTLFEEPTVAALAAHIEGREPGEPGAIRPRKLPPDGPETVHPLAPPQRRLWFLSQLAPGGTFLNVPTALRLLGPLAVPALAAALTRIAARHEPLRTTFATFGGEPVQRIASDAALPLPMVDLTQLPDEAGRLAAAVANQPFDLAAGPVARAFLLRLAPEEHVLLVTVHHLAFDGWSIGILDRELSALYPSLPPLPPLPARYVEIGAGLREVLDRQALDGQRDYWRRQLAGLPRLEMPTDRPRPASPGFRGGFREALLPHGLEPLCRRQGVTPFMALVALFQVLLARWTGQTDFAVGAPISGRGSPESEGVIGFFVNTLALRADLSGEPGLPALLSRVRQAALGAYAHQDLPFDALVEDLHPGRQAGVNPLFEVMLSLEEARLPPRLPGLDASPFPIARDVAHFDLILFVQPGPDGWRATLNHRRDLFDGATAERLLGHWTALLAAALERPEVPVLDLPLLRPAERHQAAIEWNDTAAPADLAIDRLIARQAALRPEALAVEGGGRRLSYGELDRRASRLARGLLAMSLPPETIVAICLERSPELAVGALAALRAGCAYLPLDPEAPADRLAWLVRDAAAPVVLTASPWDRAFLDGEARVLRLDEEEGAGGGLDLPLPSPILPHQLAYAIYTSGSTGAPKRAELPHGGLANLIAWYIATYRPGPGDRIGLVVNPAFDVSVLELWTALAVGASLHAPPRAAVASPRELLGWLAAEEITLCFLPTPLAEAVLGLAPPPGLALRGLMTGGDRLRQGPPPGFPAALLNLYGPTEATVGATAARVDPGTAGAASPPIGRPLANFDVHLLGPDLRPMPPGAVGEICLGGPGLARGYGGRPDLTAERFVPHPGPAPAGARLYRTGDLARLRRDGALDFLGRTDHQVKIRGVRIEPGEIEARLAAHPAVAGAAVLAVGEGAGRRLIAFVVPRPGTEIAPASLRAHLRRGLPEAMVPAALHTLDAWPLTSRGKLDRGALAALAVAAAPPELPHEPPRDGLEREIARLWCEVLRRPAVGRDESFFDLGGHSLALATVQERLEAELGRRVPLVELFEHPTVRALAAHLQSETAKPAQAPLGEAARRAGQQRQAAAWKERTRQARTAAPQPKG